MDVTKPPVLVRDRRRAPDDAEPTGDRAEAEHHEIVGEHVRPRSVGGDEPSRSGPRPQWSLVVEVAGGDAGRHRIDHPVAGDPGAGFQRRNRGELAVSVELPGGPAGDHEPALGPADLTQRRLRPSRGVGRRAGRRCRPPTEVAPGRRVDQRERRAPIAVGQEHEAGAG